MARTSPPTPVRALAGETLAIELRRPLSLRASPSAASHALARISPRTMFASRTVLAVVRQHGLWLGVLAPALGNGRVGWVRQDAARVLREAWSIDVDLSRRRGILLRRRHVFRTFALAVGTPTYPTPTGRFGVTDRLRTDAAGRVYGCCVLALSARQRHIAQDWPGGDRIAIHGTDEPASVGTPASHGCLRASEATMRLLMARVPLGARVTIHR